MLLATCNCLNIASRQFGAPRLERGRNASLPRVARGRERRRCISILQAARNVKDTPKLRDRFLRRTSAFFRDDFITRWVKKESGARNNLHAVFIDHI